jgi:cytosine/adenosine deaminase-related metal-dependent hydrolase
MSDWVAALLAFRRSADYDAAEGIRQVFRRPEFLESTAAVADIVPEVLPGDLRPPLMWLPFAELIDFNKSRERNAVERPNQPGVPAKCFGLSPHAPHTVCPALLNWAIRQNVPIAMHLAETLEELQLLRHHTGPLLETMRRADPDYDPKSVLIGKRPMDYLQLLSNASKVVIIHGNYLDDEELQFLAAHRETMSVVYCPRSHAYFRHASYPLQKMLDYGVRVLLGTDSLASVPNLNFVEEMQFARKYHPTVSPEAVYRLGTFEGASALDLLQQGFGTIQPGSLARFAVFA